MSDTVFFLVGFLTGVITMGGIGYWQRRQWLSNQRHDREWVHHISNTVVQQAQDQFFQMANERFQHQSDRHEMGLSHKKSLIDQTLQTVKKEMDHVRSNISDLTSTHQQQLGRMNGYLEQQHKTTQQLMQTTTDLKEALANSKTRGQWGERMAEDVLRFSGFIEGINYVKQTKQHHVIPDFTFILPKNKKVNMDVKFPLNNYLAFLNEDNTTDKTIKKKQFIRDVRHHVMSIADRNYITSDTLDYVIVFIPNEQIYQFMHDHDPQLIDFSLNKKVVLCSPITLYAILAVIRQAVDHVAVETRANEIMAILTRFHEQWERYGQTMDKMGRSLDQARKQYDDLVGTRTNQLDRSLKDIHAIKQSSSSINP